MGNTKVPQKILILYVNASLLRNIIQLLSCSTKEIRDLGCTLWDKGTWAYHHMTQTSKSKGKGACDTLMGGMDLEFHHLSNTSQATTRHGVRTKEKSP